MSTRLTTRLAAAVLLTGGAVGLMAPSASALTRPFPIPQPICVAPLGQPSQCPTPQPPDRPEPITDPACLRVDVEPLHCQYLP